MKGRSQMLPGNGKVSRKKVVPARLPTQNEVIGFCFMHHKQCDHLKYWQSPLRQKSRTFLLPSWSTLQEQLSFTTTSSRKMNVFRVTCLTGNRTADGSGYDFLNTVCFNLLPTENPFNLLKPTGHVMLPTSLTFNNSTFCPHCIYVFCIYLRTNSDLCHLQHKLIGFYNRDWKCLFRGTNWVFK